MWRLYDDGQESRQAKECSLNNCAFHNQNYALTRYKNHRVDQAILTKLTFAVARAVCSHSLNFFPWHSARRREFRIDIIPKQSVSRIIVPKCIILQRTILNCQHSRKKEKPRANSLHLLLHPFTAQSRCSQLLKIRTLQSCGIYNSWRSLKPHLEVDASLEVSTYTNGFISTAYGSIGNNYQCYQFVTLYCLIGLALTIKYMTYSLRQVRLLLNHLV